ncbi:ABC transporter permease [Thorsellia anophelis]|uniref:Microcin C transport system permease protein n=1 Tax=Thorsellia anophelis DSM 18579 TaxID=1123402 RepID=A0A1H9ZV28_9GAMM|nr:microcin C ABC transporter permease [Thorsellia anophelis]SES85161.1 microcin C transport system permease protein [Thorsellia anophelis DSM 18579]
MLHLNPINQLRLHKFKQNKRGVFAFYIFFLIMILAIFAELIANDKPIFVKFDGKWYFPIVNMPSEKIFTNQFDSPTNFHDPYITNIIENNGFIIWTPIKFSYNTINYASQFPFPAPPNKQNWLGTDQEGRDVIAILLYGFRISLIFGVALTLLSSSIGIIVGALQGYYGGWVDLSGQRFIEVWSSIPTLFLIILLASVVEPNFWWLLSITVLFGWMELVGLVRAEFLRMRNFDFVRSAKALGVSNFIIMKRHIMPNALVSTLTFMPFILTGSITTLTSLDFLGFGLPASYPSLGELLLQGKNNLQSPWLGLTSFIFLSIVLTTLVFIGEAIRDAFNVDL